MALLGVEAQREEATQLRPHSWDVVDLGFEPVFPVCVALAQLLASMAVPPQGGQKVR